MKLLTAPATPFGRKAKMTAAIKGLVDAIEFIDVDTSSGNDPAILRANPLGKIPVLILDDQTSIFDSKVICEYLDYLGPNPPLIPTSGPERWQCLTRAAAADGVMEASVLIVYESRFRPEEHRLATWVDRQQAKIDTGLQFFENQLASAPASDFASGMQPDYADVCLACALGYLDIRAGGTWRPANPKLASWLGDFASNVPAFAASAPR